MNCFDRQRFEANKELSILLTQLILDNPSQRFGQILRNFEFISQAECNSGNAIYHWEDEFYREPQIVLRRVQDAIKRLRP